MMRWRRWTAAVMWVALLGVAWGCASTDRSAVGGVDATEWTNNPLDRVDDRYEFEAKRRFGGRGLAYENGAWRLSDEAWSSYPARGVWRSGWVKVDDEGFTELLPSWNAIAPPGTGLVLEVRVWFDGHPMRTEPTSWLKIGEWGDPSPGEPVKTAGAARVAVDVLELERAATAFELRVRFESRDLVGRASPAVRRVVAWASRVDARRAEAMRESMDGSGGEGERIDLDVPFMPQGVAIDAVKGRVCSAAATGMVMAYRGVVMPVEAHAQGVYDAEHGIFGNWGRAVAWASSHGLEAELVRVRTWGRVRELLEAGQPIVASIRFGPGAFPSSVMASTHGHLIVIRGLTEEGDAIVNDSASIAEGEGAIYVKEELAAAWLGQGGVAYLIGSAAGEPAAPSPGRGSGRSSTAAGSYRMPR
jgi:hypothetical protein